ncbi:MAG: D-alanine--D-alanine ligase [Acutalibacteraceae bacterium]
MNIAVLAGGISSERDVSISSGKKVYDALVQKGHNVVLLDVFMGIEDDEIDIEKLFLQNFSFTKSLSIKEEVPNIEEIKNSRKDKSDNLLGKNIPEICRKADITFLALHGGMGENGQIQATLDVLGIKYTGAPYLGSAIAMNKGVTKSILLYNKIGTPYGEIFTKADEENNNISKWDKFPCVVKPCSGGSSVGVSLVETKNEFLCAMKEAFKWENEVLVEQYVKGREFSVGVIGGKALPIIEIIPKEGFYDYVNKYQSGKTVEVCPAHLSEELTKKIQNEAERAYKALLLEAYARIDFLLDENENTYCLEANTLPGMTPISLLPQEAKAEGIDFPRLCEKIIEVSLDKYK